MSSQTLRIDCLTRVEGEGALFVRLKDDRVADVQLRIPEPPRFFEGILCGRRFDEAPDITSRICGICPVAHQITSAQAIEQALSATVDRRVADLRRLFYLGEWIESHALHIYLLHAPDFLGYQDVVQMAADHPGVVERALALKKLGNDIVALIGGREIHPVSGRVGGFYRVPSGGGLSGLSPRLEQALEAAAETVRWCARLPFPQFEQEYECVALRHPEHYPVTDGRITTSSGLDIADDEFEEHFVEEQVEHSTALHAGLKRHGAYLVGPVARYNLNFDRLTPLAQEEARAAGLAPICRNPFRSIVVRAVELLYACEEALRLVHSYEPPDRPYADVQPRAGIGHSCTEAPRGVLYHRYAVGPEGDIQSARIVTPTAQNLRIVESDLRAFIPTSLGLHPDKLTWQCEQVVRNYDPCISCATHFLTLQIERG